MSRDSVAVLLWLLWHHQGGSSDIGQPLRAMLGMGQHDHLTDAQVAEARRIEAALTREAAPQASSLPVEVLAWIEARREYRRLVEVNNARVQYARTQPLGEVDCNHEYQAMCVQRRVTRTAAEAAGNALERIATTDSAVQSQQGATGGVVGEVRIQDGCIVSTSIQRPLADGGYDIVPQAAHPQAAGSAPGEAMPDPLCVQRRSDCRYPKCECPPSAGSVASPAGDDYLPEVLVRLQEAVADRVGSTVMLSKADACAVGNALLRMIATPAAGAGSAPVGVEDLAERLTDLLRQEMPSESIIYRCVEMALAATPAVSVGDAKELGRQLAAYRRMVNKLDDRIEYARESYTREEIHALLAELTAELAPTKERAE